MDGNVRSGRMICVQKKKKKKQNGSNASKSQQLWAVATVFIPYCTIGSSTTSNSNSI